MIKNVVLFQLEDVEIVVADHVQRVMKPNFGASWEEVGVENELEDTYALSSMKTLEGWFVYYISQLPINKGGCYMKT